MWVSRKLGGCLALHVKCCGLGREGARGEVIVARQRRPDRSRNWLVGGGARRDELCLEVEFDSKENCSSAADNSSYFNLGYA